MIKVSFHSWAYSSMFSRVPSYPLEEAMKRISRIGYQGIELGAARPHAWPPDLNSHDRSIIRKQLKEYRLEIVALDPCNENLNPASPIEQERTDAIKHYLDCVRLAADLECPIFIFVPGWCVYGTTFNQGWKWNVDAINYTLELAEKMKISVAIEQVSSFRSNIITRSHQVVSLLEELRSASAAAVLDTIHVMLENENPIDVAKSYGSHLVHIHAVDASAGKYERKIPGCGDFGFASFIDALEEMGYDGHLSVEVWGINPDRIAWESYQILNGLLLRQENNAYQQCCNELKK